MVSDEFIDGVYEFGEDDWIQFIDLGHLLIEENGSNEDLIPRAAATAAELIRRRIVTPGELRDDGFHPWPLPAEEAIARIEREASELQQHQRLFGPGDICWFETVPPPQQDGPTEATP